MGFYHINFVKFLLEPQIPFNKYAKVSFCYVFAILLICHFLDIEVDWVWLRLITEMAYF